MSELSYRLGPAPDFAPIIRCVPFRGQAKPTLEIGEPSGKLDISLLKEHEKERRDR